MTGNPDDIDSIRGSEKHETVEEPAVDCEKTGDRMMDPVRAFEEVLMEVGLEFTTT